MDYCKDNRKSAGGAFMICILFMILAAIGAYKWVIYREELSKRNRKRRDENYQMKKTFHKIKVRNRSWNIFENIFKKNNLESKENYGRKGKQRENKANSEAKNSSIVRNQLLKNRKYENNFVVRLGRAFDIENSVFIDISWSYLKTLIALFV